jgi:Protein of unknown function (DUF2877)
MVYGAVTIGYAVPSHDFDATVHSVFREAVNIQPQKGDCLLTLVTADCADLPQGIKLATPRNFSFENCLHVGERIFCSDDTLRGERGCFQVDLRPGVRWKCELPCLDEITPSIAEAWSFAWCALKNQMTRSGAKIRSCELAKMDAAEQPEMTRRMSVNIQDLIADTRRLASFPLASLTGLIGFGYGLTPGGDDFLVGFLAGLRIMVGNNKERKEYLSSLGKMVIRLSNRTNDISRTYLFHAVRGQVSSRLATLAHAISGGMNSVDILQATESAMQVGHSSGVEMVNGLLTGFSTWGEGLQLV